MHACLPLILVGGAHGLQVESRPHLGRVKSNRIGRLEGWYSLAPATQSNMISIMNEGRKPNIRILSQTCYLIIISYFCFFFSSAFEIFLKLIIKNVKVVPKHLDCFNWNIQQCSLLEGAIKSVLVFWSLTQLLHFVVHHSWISQDFRLLCSDGSSWGKSHRSISLSVNHQNPLKRCHLRARALK